LFILIAEIENRVKKKIQSENFREVFLREKERNKRFLRQKNIDILSWKCLK